MSLDARTSHRLKPDVPDGYLPLNAAARKLGVSRQRSTKSKPANTTPSRSSTANVQAYRSTPTALTTRCAELSPRDIRNRRSARHR
jgi:hypothetical protein